MRETVCGFANAFTVKWAVNCPPLTAHPSSFIAHCALSSPICNLPLTTEPFVTTIFWTIAVRVFAILGRVFGRCRRFARARRE